MTKEASAFEFEFKNVYPGQDPSVIPYQRKYYRATRDVSGVDINFNIETPYSSSKNHINNGINSNLVEEKKEDNTSGLNYIQLLKYMIPLICILTINNNESTLLKMFADLEQPSAGHVRWNGKADIQSQCKMAMVFHEATLMPCSNIEDNVRLPLDLRHVAKSEVRQKSTKL